MELTRVVGEKEKIARDVMNAMAPGRLQWLLQCVCVCERGCGGAYAGVGVGLCGWVWMGGCGCI